MAKSKNAPALFEVIGNSTYQAESGGRSANGIGRFGKSQRSASAPPPVKPKPKVTPPPAKPKVVPAKPPERTSSLLKRFGEAVKAKPVRPPTTEPEAMIQMEKGRVFFSLNLTNALIAAGVLGLGIFAAFLIGSRMGPDEAGTGGTQAGSAQATVAPNVFSNSDQRAENQAVPLTSVAKKNEPAAPKKGETVRVLKGGASNSAASVEPPLVAVDQGSLGAVETSEPRTPGLTYVVIESFFKKEGHDGLKHARHAQAFLASKGIPSYIIPKASGKIGWQLISRKGFDYKTEKRACLDYKQKIREFAKAYKPLPGGYGLFQGFPEKFIPSK